MPRRKLRSELLIARRPGSRLTPADREVVVQQYFALGTYLGCANKLGLSPKCVMDVVKSAYQDPNLLAVRARATDEVSGQVIDKLSQVVGSIQPEDLCAHWVTTEDKEGNEIRQFVPGPSLRDKAFTVGQLSTAHKTLAEARLGNSVDLPGNPLDLLLPETVAAGRQMVARMVKKLRIIDVEFADEGKTMAKVEHARRKAMVTEQEIEDAELTDLKGPDPFD